MAKINDVKQIVSEFDLTLTDEQIKSIARQTGEVNDIETVIAELQLSDKINMTVIKKVINAQPKPVQERCGKCDDGIIPVFNYQIRPQLAIREFPWLGIPKTWIPCPNCANPNSIGVVQTMYQTDQAWTWILLFDYLVYHKNLTIKAEHFNPADYYQNLATENIAFTQHQIDIIHKIEDQTRFRSIPVDNTQEVIQNLICSSVKIQRAN